jgi:hypothetical protein
MYRENSGYRRRQKAVPHIRMSGVWLQRRSDRDHCQARRLVLTVVRHKPTLN